jgi:hypothetical protein
MSAKTRKAALFAASAALFAGCGGGGGSDTKTTLPTVARPAVSTSTAPPAAAPVARLTFVAHGLLPARQKLPASAIADVVISSADGRPHGVVVHDGGPDRHVLIDAGAQVTIRLTGLVKGRHYKVVPDGATEPATLIVG